MADNRSSLVSGASGKGRAVVTCGGRVWFQATCADKLMINIIRTASGTVDSGLVLSSFLANLPDRFISCVYRFIRYRSNRPADNKTARYSRVCISTTCISAILTP